MRSLILALAMLALVTGCAGGGGGVETGNPSVYATTSTLGDFGTWVIYPDSTFEMEWLVTAPVTGATQYTYRATASCQAANSYGFRPCTLLTASCVAGTLSCPVSAPAPGDNYQLLEMPGVALIAYSTAQDHLHIGTIRGDCTSDVSGDYTFINTGLARQEVFGVYRSDSSFSSLVQANFGFSTPLSPTLSHLTQAGGGSGATSFSVSCQDGVRTINSGGVTSRATLTESGLFMFDFPALLGGAFAFREDLSAGTDDLAGRTLQGFVYATGGTRTQARLTLGSRVGSQVPYSSLSYQSGGAQSVAGHYLISAQASAGAYGFSSSHSGSPAPYSANALSATYPTPDSIRGLFINPGGSSASNFTIVTAMKNQVNGKLLVFATELDLRLGAIRITGVSIFMEAE